MATSGSVDFTLTRNQLITTAFELIGEATEGEALGSEDISVAGRACDMMIKAMVAHGLQLWKRKKYTLTLTASQASYTIGRSGTPDLTADRPLRVLEATLVGNGTVDTSRVTLINMSKNEYEAQSDLTTSGQPSQYHFDPVLDNSKLYLWPVPDATSATNKNVELIVQTPMEDMDSGTDNFDFPAEWLEALSYGLAVRLAPRYDVDLQERYLLRKEAKEALDLVKGFDVEEASVFLQPDNEGMF